MDKKTDKNAIAHLFIGFNHLCEVVYYVGVAGLILLQTSDTGFKAVPQALDR